MRWTAFVTAWLSGFVCATAIDYVLDVKDIFVPGIILLLASTTAFATLWVSQR